MDFPVSTSGQMSLLQNIANLLDSTDADDSTSGQKLQYTTTVKQMFLINHQHLLIIKKLSTKQLDHKHL